jgi:hypothetical protein
VSKLSIKHPVGLVVACLGGAITASAAASLALGLVNSTHPYFLLGFEFIVGIAGVFAILVALGRFALGPAMALLCVAGAVGVGSLLGHRSSGGFLGGAATIYLLGRCSAAFLLLTAAAWVVLARRPHESVASLVRGMLFGFGLILLVPGLWLSRGHLGALGPAVKALVMLFGAAVGLGLLAASVHFTIRAFEFGRVGDARPNPFDR